MRTFISERFLSPGLAGELVDPNPHRIGERQQPVRSELLPSAEAVHTFRDPTYENDLD
jgi:hypothetical protein